MERARRSVVKVTGAHGAGAGVIYEVDSWSTFLGDQAITRIVTSYHVVKGQDKVHVEGSDGWSDTATVVHYDRRNGVAALIACCDTDRPMSPVSDKAGLDTGSAVFTVDYPSESGEATVTRGRVSGVWRDNQRERWVLQMDAPIGLEGGHGPPLFTADGKVIGINTSPLGDIAAAFHGGEALDRAVSARVTEDLLAASREGLKVDTPTERLAFPDWPTIKANVDVFPGVWYWSASESVSGNPNHYGDLIAAVSFPSFIGVRDEIPTTKVFVYLDDEYLEQEFDEVIHRSLIWLMLVAVGHDADRAEEVVNRHLQQLPLVVTSCMVDGLINLETWPEDNDPDARFNRYSLIRSHEDEDWMEMDQCQVRSEL